MDLLSGDQLLTFMVPCPPYKYAITFGAPPATGINRNITFLYAGCALGSISVRNEINTIHLPSGDICGNQLWYSSNVSCSLPDPSGLILHICIVPEALAL